MGFSPLPIPLFHMAAFTESDLLLKDDYLSQLKEALENTGELDPIGQAIDEAEQQVALYTGRYTLTDPHRFRLVRPIVLWVIHRKVGIGTPEQFQNGYEEAMKELRAIRDGDFHEELTLADGRTEDGYDLSGYGYKQRIAHETTDTSIEG